jgi:hypothetical protein
MGRVAGEEDAAVLVSLGNDTVAGPRAHSKQFEGNAFA